MLLRKPQLPVQSPSTHNIFFLSDNSKQYQERDFSQQCNKTGESKAGAACKLSTSPELRWHSRRVQAPLREQPKTSVQGTRSYNLPRYIPTP